MNNPASAIFVYQHLIKQDEILILDLDDANKFMYADNRNEYNHIATLDPATFLTHLLKTDLKKDLIKELIWLNLLKTKRLFITI